MWLLLWWSCYYHATCKYFCKKLCCCWCCYEGYVQIDHIHVGVKSWYLNAEPLRAFGNRFYIGWKLIINLWTGLMNLTGFWRIQKVKVGELHCWRVFSLTLSMKFASTKMQFLLIRGIIAGALWRKSLIKLSIVAGQILSWNIT